jgi:cytochrome d ubiquinol oxidase subunit II
MIIFLNIIINISLFKSMETFWFIALTFMIVLYIVLDGFDLGAGIIYLIVAKNDSERRMVLNSIGPYWDGNEVWLIAAGGVLFFAFPRFYAASFSGFYLPLMIVLWLLIGRALGIELRKHIDNALWRSFWDVVFCVSSLLLVIIFGAALGNIVTGVPLNKDGYFFEPLWTTFSVSPHTGILDWFTVIMGLVAFFTLIVHGANFIAMKTDDEIQKRARKLSSKMNWLILIFSVFALLSASFFNKLAWENYSRSPIGFIFPVTGSLALIGLIFFRYKQKDTHAFLSSSLFIISMLAATAYSLYPNLLASTNNQAFNLTIFNSKTGEYAMNIALIWWIIGIILVFVYFVFLFYKFRGKVKIENSTDGY